MNRIDRYISGLFWQNFAAGLLIFMTIFAAVDALGMMVTYKDASLTGFLHYYQYALPEVLYRMAPVACVLSTIFTLATLNRTNELVALFASGMSLVRLCLPILFSILFVCGIMLLLSDRVLPQFARMKNFVFYNEIKMNPSLYSMVKTNKIWYRSKDTIFYIKTLNEQTHRAQGLTLYYFNEKWDLVQMVNAQEVELGGESWKLKDGSVTLFTEDSSFPLTSNFKEKSIVMGEDAKDLSSTANTSDVLSLSELGEFIDKNKEAGLDTLRYEVDYHSKYGFALAPLIMSLLGIPFSVRRARSGGAMIGVAICLGLVFVYWIFYSSALTLGNYGQLPPIAAAWIPNAVMGAGASLFIRRMRI